MYLIPSPSAVPNFPASSVPGSVVSGSLKFIWPSGQPVSSHLIEEETDTCGHSWLWGPGAKIVKELQTGTQLSYLVTQGRPSYTQDFFPPRNHLWSPFPEGWVALAMVLCPLVALAGIAASPRGKVLRFPRLRRAESQAHKPRLEALELGARQLDSPRCRPAHTCCSSRP